MPGFTKLFSSIVTSSVWCEDHATRIVWVAMLAICDAEGVVDGSVPGLANVARVSIEEMSLALKVLSGPDPHSRTTEHEGRRIKAVPGGWQILNYSEYRKKGQGAEGSRAPYFRKRRAEQKEELLRTQELLRTSDRNNELLRATQKQKQLQAATAPVSPPVPPEGGSPRPAAVECEASPASLGVSNSEPPSVPPLLAEPATSAPRSKRENELATLKKTPDFVTIGEAYAAAFDRSCGLVVLRAAKRALAAGHSVDECLAAIEVMRVARDSPEQCKSDSYASWCVEHGKLAADFLLRPATIDKLVAERQGEDKPFSTLKSWLRKEEANAQG